MKPSETDPRNETGGAMSDSDSRATQSGGGAAPRGRDGRMFSQAAGRALAEAEARRAPPEPERPTEVNGRGGPDPVRYGDWEVKGLASDF